MQPELVRFAKLISSKVRRNLVCVRLGDQSVFQRWFVRKQERSWDLLISYYGTDIPFEADAEFIAVGGLSKFSALKTIGEDNEELFRRYDYIWCIDDDLEISFDDVDRFLGIMRDENLHLAQPALTRDSYASWPLLFVEPNSLLRLTDFVEIMMPAFSRSAFQICLPTFDQSISGYGLDEVWGHLLNERQMRIAVVDSVCVRHTKPIDLADGAFYRYLRRLDIDPQLERQILWRHYGLSAAKPKVLGTATQSTKRRQRGLAPTETEGGNVQMSMATLYLDLVERAVTGLLHRDPAADPWSSKVFDLEKRLAGRDWPNMAHTMIGFKRAHNLRVLSSRVIQEGIPGDFIETGVWRGGACILMRAVLAALGDNHRRVFVADSFAGLPPPKPDLYPADAGDNHHTFSELAISEEEVRRNFDAYGLLDERVVFLKGWFSETLPEAPIEELAILRLDGDMYESTTDALVNLYPKLSVGGYCIVDDGNVPGCRKAITDYVGNTLTTQPHYIDIDGWGFYWQKLG